MIDIDKSKRYLIVAEPCYREAVLAVKNKNPEWNFKFMTKDEFVSMVRFGYGVDPIPFLLKYQKEDYTTLKTYLRVLRFAERGVNQRLDEIYDILDANGYIEKDPLGHKEISLYNEILFFEGHEDFEMQKLFEKEQIAYTLISFEDLGYTDRRTDKVFYLYPDKLAQFCSLFSHIRKEIVEENTKPSDIAITVHSDSDDFYIGRISRMFGVPCETRRSHSILSKGDNSGKLKRIQAERSFEFTDEEKEKSRDLYSIVERYGLDKLEFDFAYPNLLEIIGNSSYSTKREINGVLAQTSISFKPDAVYYVTNFIHDDFYEIYSDSGCFTDSQLKELGCNPSYVLTKMDRRKKKAFLKYMDVRFLSRVERHQDDKMYNSQFAKEKPSDPETGEKEYSQVKRDYDDDGLYTKEASDFVRNIFKSRYFYAPDSEYRSYDHSFSGVKAKLPDDFAVTSLDDYFECPFSYYMDRILHIDSNDPNSDAFKAHLGTIIHHVFEKIHTTDDNSFDFDRLYDEGIDEVRPEIAKLNEEDREHELALYELNREHARMFALNMRVQNKKGNIIDEIPEKDISFTLESKKTGNTYKITGKIDKLLYTSATDSEGKEHKYWTLIDYKTGAESFEMEETKSVFLGNHLQLPLYYYHASSNAELNKGYEYGGCGIEHIFANKPSEVKRKSPSEVEDHIKEYTDKMKLSGVYFDDQNKNYLESFSGKAKKSSYIYIKTKVKKNSNALRFKDVEGDDSMSDKYEYSYKEMIQDAVNAAVETTDSIFACDFRIAPTKVKEQQFNGDGTHCGFCKFRNICYRDTREIDNCIPLINEKFHLGSDDDEEEE